MVNWLGVIATLGIGSVAAPVGLVTVAFAPQIWAVAVELGFVGLGIAPMIPLAMAAAQRAHGLAP